MKRSGIAGLRSIFQIRYVTYLKFSRDVSLLDRVLPFVILEKLKRNLSRFTTKKRSKVRYSHD